MANPEKNKPEESLNQALTSIHGAYTLSNTPNSGEVDKIIVQHFQETLAEIALSVASRKSKEVNQ